MAPRFARNAAEGTYCVIGDGLSRTAVVLLTGQDPLAPLAAVLALDENFEARVRAARQFRRLMRGQNDGDYPGGTTKQQRDRHRLMLRALDANFPFESYRSIAEGLFGRRGEHWEFDAMRDKVKRLVKDGRALVQGGYLKLLRGSRSG